MTDYAYPTSLAELESWSRDHKVPVHQARVRFMEFVILDRLAQSRPLRNGMVLKGGNALRFAYQGCRSTKDLDFTVVDDEHALPNDGDLIKQMIDESLLKTEQRFGVKAKCQSVHKKPPRPEASHPTYEVKVGYIFPNDKYFHNFADRNVSDTVPLEISFGDMVCETIPLSLVEHETPRLLVCSLEDLIAEKLRALLQQPIRNRNRTQDVYDIAACRRRFADKLDLSKIAQFLKKKSSIRPGIEARKSRFNNKVRDLAKAETAYEKMMNDQAAADPIDFDIAWPEVLALVQSLDIPN